MAANSSSGGIFSRFFESPEQTIVNGAGILMPHGLGIKPKLYTASLICKVAEIGFNVDEETPLLGFTGGGTSNFYYGGAAGVNSTNIFASITGSGAIVYNPTNGSVNNITNANWALILRAWA